MVLVNLPVRELLWNSVVTSSRIYTHVVLQEHLVLGRSVVTDHMEFFGLVLDIDLHDFQIVSWVVISNTLKMGEQFPVVNHSEES
jgi:hypothetical protein